MGGVWSHNMELIALKSPLSIFLVWTVPLCVIFPQGTLCNCLNHPYRPKPSLSACIFKVEFIFQNLKGSLNDTLKSFLQLKLQHFEP